MLNVECAFWTGCLGRAAAAAALYSSSLTRNHGIGLMYFPSYFFRWGLVGEYRRPKGGDMFTYIYIYIFPHKAITGPFFTVAKDKKIDRWMDVDTTSV